MSFELEFDKPVPELKSRFKKVNPMVIKYGPGPEDKRCKHCEYSEWHQHGAKVYVKCKLRGITRGAGTDHLANWETCSRFREESAVSSK